VSINSAGIINESGGGTTVVEDWEGSSPLSDWSGDTGGVKVADFYYYEGSHSVFSKSGYGDNIITKDGTNYGPADTPFSVYIHNRDDTNPGGIAFGGQNSNGRGGFSGYSAVSYGYGSLYFFRYDSGSRTSLRYTSSADLTEFRVVLSEWKSGGSMTMELRDLNGNVKDTLSTTDGTYGSGRIGIKIKNPLTSDYLTVNGV